MTALELSIIWLFLGGMVVTWAAKTSESYESRWYETALEVVSWPLLLYIVLTGDDAAD